MGMVKIAGLVFAKVVLDFMDAKAALAVGGHINGAESCV